MVLWSKGEKNMERSYRAEERRAWNGVTELRRKEHRAVLLC